MKDFFPLSLLSWRQCLADSGKDRGLEEGSGRPEPINQTDEADEGV